MLSSPAAEIREPPYGRQRDIDAILPYVDVARDESRVAARKSN